MCNGKEYIVHLVSSQGMARSEWVIMEFNVAAGIFHPFATIKQ